MMSSARASSEDGSLRPSVFAVLRLTTSSNRLLDGKGGGLLTLQYSIHVDRRLADLAGQVRPVGHKPARFDVLAAREDGRELRGFGKIGKHRGVADDRRVGDDDHAIDSICAELSEGALKLGGVVGLASCDLQSKRAGGGLHAIRLEHCTRIGWVADKTDAFREFQRSRGCTGKGSPRKRAGLPVGTKRAALLGHSGQHVCHQGSFGPIGTDVETISRILPRQ